MRTSIFKEKYRNLRWGTSKKKGELYAHRCLCIGNLNSLSSILLTFSPFFLLFFFFQKRHDFLDSFRQISQVLMVSCVEVAKGKNATRCVYAWLFFFFRDFCTLKIYVFLVRGMDTYRNGLKEEVLMGLWSRILLFL